MYLRKLLNCKFDHDQCTVSDFYKTDVYNDIHMSMQPCYSFNFGKNINGTKVNIKKVLKNGEGLSLEMYIGKSSVKNHAGVNLLIHDSEGYRDYRDRINVPSGK